MRKGSLLVFIAAFVACAGASAADFYGNYQPRTGDLNVDGAPDIYLQFQPRLAFVDVGDIPVPINVWRNTISDFVLQQGSGSLSNISPLSPAQRSQVRGWPSVQVPMEPNDYNGDGRLDLLLKGVSIGNTNKDVLVFAPQVENAAPLATTVIDSTRQLFIRDVSGWIDNPNYFDSGLYWQTYTGYFQVVYFNCGGSVYAAWAGDPNISTCFAGCQYLGWEWVNGQLSVLRFDPTGFSLAALDFLDHLAPHIGTDGQFSVPEADAAILRQHSRDILGVPVFGQTASDTLPRPYNGDWDWIRWLARRAPWFLLSSLLGELEDIANLTQLYRVAGKPEMQIVLGSLTWPMNNPSGFYQKQFWRNLPDAREYQQAVFTNNWDPYAVSLTILSIRVTPSTLALGYPFTDPINGSGRPAVSFDAAALPALNRDTRAYGVWKHGTVMLPPPPPLP